MVDDLWEGQRYLSDFDKKDLFKKCQICGEVVPTGRSTCTNGHKMHMSTPHKVRHRCRFCQKLLTSVKMVARGEYFVRYFEHGECECGAHYDQIFGDFYKWHIPKTKKLSKAMDKKMAKLRLWTE